MSRIPMNLHFTGNYGAQEKASEYPCVPSKYIQWVDDSSDYLVTVDEYQNLPEGNHKYNIAVLMEPVTLTKHNYDFVLANKENYDIIFSLYSDYGDGSDRFKYYPGGARTFIRPEEQSVYSKTKNITSVVSKKRMTHHHHIRHSIKQWHQDNDIRAVDYHNPPLGEKVAGLYEYRFELVIENEDSANFSEKLIDSMLCGCIPIYYTDMDLSYLQMFDMNAIVIVRSESEVQELLISNKLNEEYYNSRLDAVKHNFEVAKRYTSLGDVLWNYGLREFVEEKSESCEVL